MICSVLVSVILGVQPVCTESTFSIYIEPNLHGDTEVVARAIFDEYLEHVAKLDTTPIERQTPVEFAMELRDEEMKADALFDSLLDSLAILKDDPDWSDVIKQVRRRVLLYAREANNPWPNTQWFDIVATVQTNPKFLNDVDSFLLQNVDADRYDRFLATIAMLEGDKETCAKAERRTMQRWAVYNELIEPFETDDLLSHIYHAIPSTDEVARIFFRITVTIKEPSKTNIVANVFGLYRAMHEKQKRAVVTIVKNTRINDGVDPLSSGCGTFDKTRILILQKTAEMYELNTATIESMIQVLTPEQRQQLELDG